MFILRAVGLLLIIAIALCVGASLLTGQRHYMQWAKTLLRVGVAVGVVFAALLLFERLVAPMV
ncbi:hypothetical protein VVD49_10025 [Uliginosibacterium sp. H3]|uniref:Uncharacterized protein n=1 Tax=Uliginosibacterium silvisoli TaxID=3114758 RepID=A0ABU6K2N2_9RHOO|nr:hypothetical protein [Uliginosibacterium sp. H3]